MSAQTQYPSANVDVTGKAHPTVGENIRFAQKLTRKLYDIIYPVGSVIIRTDRDFNKLPYPEDNSSGISWVEITPSKIVVTGTGFSYLNSDLNFGSGNDPSIVTFAFYYRAS